MSLVSSLNRSLMTPNEKLINGMFLHTKNMGGSLVNIFGGKGSGKTALLSLLAQNVKYENNVSDSYETVLWRGGTIDAWVNFPEERYIIFTHENDEIVFKDDDEKIYNFNTIKYTTVGDLFKKLHPYKINVIYEPLTYKISNKIKNIIINKYNNNKNLFDTYIEDTSIFWYELIDYTIKYKTPSHFVSIFIDNCESMLYTPSDNPKWNLNMWLKDNLKEIRRKKISLYISCPNYTDIDGRILPGIRYRIYLKGCKIPEFSLTSEAFFYNKEQSYDIRNKPGYFYIERDCVSMSCFDKPKSNKKVYAEFL